MSRPVALRSAIVLGIVTAVLCGCVLAVVAFEVGVPGKGTIVEQWRSKPALKRPRKHALPQVSGRQVAGTVFTSAWAPPETMVIADLELYLEDTVSLARTPAVRTDLDGFYLFSDVADGMWRLCTEAPGWAAACDPNPVLVAGASVGAPPKEFAPIPPVVSGTATLADNSPCNFHDGYFGVDVRTTVTLRDFNDAPVSPLVTANRSGQYLLPAVPTGTYVATAVCEGAKARLTLSTAGGAYAALTFANARPVVNEVVPINGVLGVRRGTPGGMIQVQVNAVDPDGDSLHYLWIPSSSSAPFVSSDMGTVTWALPTGASEPLMHVLVRDGKGGYVRRSRRVSTGPALALFTGRVRSDDGLPVVGADVRVNGEAMASAADGGFSLEVTESPRYVLSVDAPGYELRSEVSAEPLYAHEVVLRRAKVFVVDPTQNIFLEDTRPRYVCVGGPNQGQDCPCGDDVSCAPGTCELVVDGLGTRVEILANALEDENGNPPSGPLELSLSTLDIRQPGRFPGDFSGRDTSNQLARLVSWGATDIKIVDGAGNRFNLKPAATARLSIPVSNPDSPPPSTIPVWFYDPDEGVWLEEGTAILKTGRYETMVTHFSTVNLDLKFSDAACLKVVLAPPFVGTSTDPIPIRITMLTGTAQGSVFEKLFADQVNALVRLPPGDEMKIEILDAPNGTPVAGQSVSVTIGGATAAGLDLSLAFPYDGCAGPIVFLGGSPSPPPGGNFLEAYGNNATQTTAYYAAIDPYNTATTFSAWLTRNGLIDRFDYDQRAVYYNKGDLALWRGMHMARPPGALADEIVYWVNNYTNPAAAIADVLPDIAVAMEFTRAQDGNGDPFGDPFTKFFVFKINAAQTDLELQPSADLDLAGEKYVPGLCVVCHAGQYYNGNSGEEKLSARFIPFALDSFDYDSTPWDKDSQQAAFKELNLGIYDPSNQPPLESINPRKSTPNIEALITGWYSGTDPNKEDESYVPADWRASPLGGTQDVRQVQLYQEVYQKSCRGCHGSRDGFVSFSTYSQFANQFIESTVCGGRIMPHALVPYKNFWLSSNPSQRDELKLGVDSLSSPAGQCCPCGKPGFTECDTPSSLCQ